MLNEGKGGKDEIFRHNKGWECETGYNKWGLNCINWFRRYEPTLTRTFLNYNPVSGQVTARVGDHDNHLECKYEYDKDRKKRVTDYCQLVSMVDYDVVFRFCLVKNSLYLYSDFAFCFL